MKRLNTALLSLFLLVCVLLSACEGMVPSGVTSSTLEDLATYSGQPYAEVNGNQPSFRRMNWLQRVLNSTVRWTVWAAAAWPTPTWVWTPCPPRSGAASAR